MRQYLMATRQQGFAGELRTCDLELRSSHMDTKPCVAIHDDSMDVTYVFDAEQLLRAVRAAWEIVKPLEQLT